MNVLYNNGDLTKVFTFWLEQIGKGFDLMKEIYIFDNISLFHFTLGTGLIILLLKMIHFDTQFFSNSKGIFVSSHFNTTTPSGLRSVSFHNTAQIGEPIVRYEKNKKKKSRR